MADELQELIGFLSSPSPQVKKAAVDIVRDLTGSDDGFAPLAARSDRLLPPLSQILRDPPEVSAPAAEALINLSQNHAVAEKLVSIGTVGAAMEVMYKVRDRRVVRLMVMLLANLTQLESGATSLLQVGDKMEGLYVSKLVRSFCKSSSDETTEDTYEHVASILVNISKLETGRKILLEPKAGLLKQIVRQFDSAGSLRKKGETDWVLQLCSSFIASALHEYNIELQRTPEAIIFKLHSVDCRRSYRVCGTIRNCCFEADNQLQNLLLISEFLWPALLLPVAGNKILTYFLHEDKKPINLLNMNLFSKKSPEVYSQEDTSKMPLELANALSHERESVDDPEIRKQALEAIYLISLQEAGRSSLWSVNGPRILQVGYEDEEDPKVMEAYELVGSLLVDNAGSEEP